MRSPLVVRTFFLVISLQSSLVYEVHKRAQESLSRRFCLTTAELLLCRALSISDADVFVLTLDAPPCGHSAMMKRRAITLDRPYPIVVAVSTPSWKTKLLVSTSPVPSAWIRILFHRILLCRVSTLYIP